VAAASVAVVAAVSAYPAVATDRLEGPISAAGGAAVAVLVAGLAFRWWPAVAGALTLSATAYGVYLGFRGGAVDGWAPLVAAALFMAAELAFRALEPSNVTTEPEVLSRGAIWLLGGTVVTAVLGALLLVAAGSTTAGLWLEAFGVAAAVAALALVVAVVSSSR
jgi:hypothetical protein